MLPIKLTIEVLLFSLLIISIVLYFVRNNLISVKYSLVWIFAIIALMFLSLTPNVLMLLKDVLGFELVSNMFFTLMIGILTFVVLMLTIIVSGQKEKIIMLVQEVSILKAEQKDKTK